MRLPVDLPPEQLEALTELGRAEGRSLEALVREAIAEYLGGHRTEERTEAFGSWRDAGELEDVLAYQARLRAEWE